MSADLHIHILEGVTEHDLAVFQCNVIGSKWHDLNDELYAEHDRRYNELYDKFQQTPNVWVGEVSWLKAALFNDPENFIPDPIGRIRDIIGDDLPVITDILIKKVGKALSLNNSTPYRVTARSPLITFLRKHKGKKAFCISW